LGVTDAWAKRFEGIATAPPSWYYSSTVRGPNFSTVFFTSMLMKTGSRINTALSSTPVNANVGSGGVKIGGGGGFSGGGGSAGGGFGGGGGGRW
ncbi:MAG: hypothetical protein FWF08_08310, partial [Oscillospiraceae bacterium]|nr:hypothetical protein [Oscillospiraceae bacterium]